MKEYLSLAESQRMLLCVARAIVEAEPMLTEVDLAIGDGDHGTGMALGFGEVERMLLEPCSYKTVKELFTAVGCKLIDTMGGASGVLFGTFFISGILAVQSKDTLSLEDFAAVFESAGNAIARRGKAQPGDKTMLDALIPAADALRESVRLDMSLTDGFLRASEAAADGVEKTKYMTAKAGRARSYKDASIGHQDAGATSVSIMVDAMYEFLSKHDQ